MCLINIEKLKRLQGEYRNKYGKITQDEIALKIGISSDNYSKLLRDETPSPLLATAIKIADFYDVSLDWLTDRDHVCCITKLERTVIRYIRENVFNLKALQMAIDHYENPSELSIIMREIHLMIPEMDIETAKATHKLLTSKIEM